MRVCLLVQTPILLYFSLFLSHFFSNQCDTANGLERNKHNTCFSLELHEERADFGVCRESRSKLIDVKSRIFICIDLFKDGVDDAIDCFELFVVHARRFCRCVRVIDLPSLFEVFDVCKSEKIKE